MPCVDRARATVVTASSLVAVLCILPAPAQSGEVLDALSSQARRTADMLVRQAVVYDNCRGRAELDDEAAEFYVDLLSQALTEHPQYGTLDADGRKVLLLNLLHEMQQAVDAAPAPDCSKGYSARRT
jgi:hypothetical protein